jgi:anti-anti-sigma factor
MSSTNYKIAGRLDATTSSAHRLALQGLPSGDTDSIALDLSALDYVSSAGLQILLLCATATKQKGGGLSLIDPKTQVLGVLRLTGLMPPPSAKSLP